MKVALGVPSRVDLSIVLVTAALSRLILFFFHVDVGDTPTYELLAENILRGCGLSFSEPTSASCVLTSGGYFPGYPAFMALNWFLFGHSNFPILLSQLGCYLLSLFWLLTALSKLTESRKVVLSVGMLLAISPLQIGWFRFVMTEPLVISTSTWFLAELVMSVAIGSLRKFHLALALSASIYIRPDSIVMSVGILMVAFFICDFKNAVKQTLIIALLTSIPVSLWMIRNLTIGHAPLSINSELAPKAPGYLFWLNTWIVNEYERADANFPLWRTEYSKINLHNSKYVNDEERKVALSLIEEISAMDGKPFPIEIDNKFYEIAYRKIQNRNYYLPYVICTERLVWLLFNPFSSWGLPLEMKDINRSLLNDAISDNNLHETFTLLDGYKLAIGGKLIIFSYRVFLFFAFIIIVYCAFLRKIHNQTKYLNSDIKSLLAGVATVVVTRLTFFLYLGGLESRYMAEIIPLIELCVALSIAKGLTSIKYSKV